MEMKTYRRFAVVVFALLAVAAVARWALIWPTAAESGSSPAEQQSTSRVVAQQTPGVPVGTPGPTTELLKMMAVDKPDFGIKVVRTFDASGKPAYETKGGDLFFFTNASVSYNSTADKPMIIVINAKARKIVAVADIDMPSTPHGITLSPDAKYIYLPSGPSTANVVRGRAEGFFGGPGSFGAPTAVVDTKTLKLVALIETGGSTHHTQVFADRYVMFDSFRGPLPIFLLDPTNKLVKLDLERGRILGIAPTGRGPYGIRLSPDEKIAYVANKGEGGNGQKGATFAAIDTNTMSIVREQLSCPDGLCQADHIVLSPDGKELWISNNMGSITVFDRETLKLLSTIQTPKLGDPHGGTFVQVAADNRSAKVVADIGGPHGGVSPYTAVAAAPADRPSNALAVIAKDFKFVPATLDVSPGQKIVFEFENRDEADHNIVSKEAAFQEVVLGGSQRKTVAWTAPSKPGTFKFVCTYHRGMEMTVNVK